MPSELEVALERVKRLEEALVALRAYVETYGSGGAKHDCNKIIDAALRPEGT